MSTPRQVCGLSRYQLLLALTLSQDGVAETRGCLFEWAVSRYKDDAQTSHGSIIEEKRKRKQRENAAANLNAYVHACKKRLSCLCFLAAMNSQHRVPAQTQGTSMWPGDNGMHNSGNVLQSEFSVVIFPFCFSFDGNNSVYIFFFLCTCIILFFSRKGPAPLAQKQIVAVALVQTRQVQLLLQGRRTPRTKNRARGKKSGIYPI